MARGELHVQLSVNYADDEKFEEVSRSSRLLYVDALCLAKELLNDGEFSPSKVRKLMYPESARAASRAAKELVDAGLWRWDADRQTYIICAWLKRNKSRSQIEQDRHDAEEAASLGNHKRWHIDRERPDSKCRHCREERPPTPSPPRSGTRSGLGNGGVSPETETETETETKNKEQPPDPPRRASTPARELVAPEDNPGPAERLVTAWIQSCNRRPPSQVVADVGKLVADMLRDEIDSADIERGMQLWQSRGSNPRTLPSYVNQVMNARPTNVVPITDRRPSTTDQRVADALAIGARLQAAADRKALEG